MPYSFVMWHQMEMGFPRNWGTGVRSAWRFSGCQRSQQELKHLGQHNKKKIIFNTIF